jgi:hypothetical protein
MIKRNSLVVVMILAILCIGVLKSFGQQENNYETLFVSLDEEFILYQNQSAIIAKDLEIKIVQFYNSPCPANVQCIWSGVGIKFAYKHDGKAEIGMMVQAFGYQTTIIESDFETYAKLKITKI